MLRVASAICLAAAAFGASDASAQAGGIGTITNVINQAFHTPPGGAELPANTHDTLVTDETLRTDKDATLSVLFVDGSELNIEAESEVILSDYVFNEQTDSSSGIIELNTGLFHFNSNQTADSGIVLQTPVATIGIRGTEFLVSVAADATVVDILEGAVEITPKGGGKSVVCEGGQSALVAGSDADAMCGDLGSFSTAAGTPPAQADIAQGRIGDGRGGLGDRPGNSGNGGSPGGGSGGGNPGGGTGGGGSGGGDPGGGDPGGGDPGGGGNSGGNTNHSGHGDGSNPGKGHDKGNGGNSGGNNGGANNPGGGKK